MVKPPFVLRNDLVTYVDVDDTLVFPVETQEEYQKAIPIGIPGFEQYFIPNKKLIEVIKLHKCRGHAVIVWSQGGWDWANEVVKAVGLNEFVDAILSKPRWLADDLPAAEFMPKNRKYDR